MEIIKSNQPLMPSNSKFGYFFTFVFAVGSAYFFWKARTTVAITLIIFTAIFAIVTIVAPGLLKPFNRLWFELGLLLGKIVSPVVLGLIFFTLITPISLVMRLFGRDELLLKKRMVSSYWIDRYPTGPAPESFNNQF